MKTYEIKTVESADLPLESPLWNQANEGEINEFPWKGSQTNAPKTYFYMMADKNGIGVKFFSNETNLVGNAKAHNTDVYTDSCVELFVNASPETTNKYLNFELSVTGYMHLGLGSGRFDRVLQHIDFDILKIDTRIILNTGWEAKFYIPFSLLREYYHNISNTWAGNLQKLCEECEVPHFGCWNIIGTEKPDFHAPQFFGNILLK